MDELSKEALSELTDHLHDFVESSMPMNFRIASKSMIKNMLRSEPEAVIRSLSNLHAWMHKHNLEPAEKYRRSK